MRPDLVQWAAVIYSAFLGAQRGGWFILLGPAILGLVLAHNRYGEA